MAYKILYTEDALVDLEILLEYIRLENPSAAERFGMGLLDYVDLLKDFPEMGWPVPARPSVRKLLHSPIRIYYRVRKDRKVIEVLHFWHGSRLDPLDL